MRKSRTAVYLLCGVAVGVISTPVLAQDRAVDTTTADSQDPSNTIIVTAQRRSESLARTPVSVSVLSGDALSNAQIVSEQDLQTSTPGLSVRAGVNSNQLNYSIRGASQDAYSGTRPGVLPYLNEVQIGGAGGASAFYDLQSVQVLKGPQGTLFGRSATGGAVLFTTAKPTDTFEGYVSATAGNYDLVKLEGMLNLPIAADTVMARVAGFYQERDGFQRNLFDGGREGDIKRYGGRASLTVELSDTLRNELVVDHFRSNGESVVSVISGLLPFTGGGTGNPPYFPAELLYGGIEPGARATAIATLAAFTGVDPVTVATFYDGYFADPRRPANGLRGFLEDTRARNDPFVVSSNAYNFYRARNTVVTNMTSFDIGSGLELKNIFGYTHLRSAIAQEADGTPFGISNNDVIGGAGRTTDNLTKQISNEFQLVGELDRLDFVTGLYFSDETSTTFQDALFFDIFFGGSPTSIHYEISNLTYAGFGQGTFKLNDNGLSATAGLRYTSEKVGKLVLPTSVFRVGSPDSAPPGQDYDQSKTYKNLSWNFGVQQQVNPDLMLYAATRRAFKSGGFNGTLPPVVGLGDIGGDSYKAERVTDLEFGTKYQGYLAGSPARFNLALFHSWITDSQRTAYSFTANSVASVTVNVPRSKVYGADFDAQIAPTEWLTVGGSLNLAKGKFTEGEVVANSFLQSFDRVPDLPSRSGTFYVDATAPINDTLSLLLHGDVYGQSKFYTGARSENFDGTTIPGYALVNFRAGLDSDDGWSLIANLKNAFNKIYYVGGLATGEVFQVNSIIPGEPRTISVEARFKF